jgi:hypothetical protein
MNEPEFLLSYGRLGDFGRFRAAHPLALQRGERAVVRSHRGLEIARVLRPATPRHAHFLPNTTVGQLLRPAGPDDDEAEAKMAERGRVLLDRAADLTAELHLPLEMIDAEVLLDGRQAVLHHLRAAACDVRPLVSTLSREFDLQLLLQDLTRTSAPESEEHDEHGCGREGCGGGNCGSCGSGGGCGSCGTARPEEVQAYFAGLREKMEQQRMPLL